jgi:hypothetical protein
MMRLQLIAACAAGLLVALPGCGGQSAVDTNVPKAEFVKEVDQKLTDFESRISKVKSQAQGREAGASTVIESATEMAEEKIRVIRHTQVPGLNSASDEETVAQAKKDINRALNEIDSEVKRAEVALAGAKSDKEKFAEATQGKLNDLAARLKDVHGKAMTAQADVQTRITAAVKSADEAIEEAGKALDRYHRAPDDALATIRSEVNRLIDSGEAKVAEAHRIFDDWAKISKEREDYRISARQKIDELEQRLADLNEKAAAAPESAQGRYNVARESAEEALKEARKALDRYMESAESVAMTTKNEVESLINKAGEQLSEADKIIEDTEA